MTLAPCSAFALAVVLGACSSPEHSDPSSEGGSGSAGVIPSGTGGGDDPSGGNSAAGGNTAAGGNGATGGSDAAGDGSATGGNGAAGGRDAGSQPTGPTPQLVPGVWRRITPAALKAFECPPAPPTCQGVNGVTYGATSIEIDPSNSATLYLTVDQWGLWKTTDGGMTWVTLGVRPSPYNPPSVVNPVVRTYLDSPYMVRVDPGDSSHLYATEGIRGYNQGFWISHDAGVTWLQPQGFVDVAEQTTYDITMITVDPGDFRHVLLGSHSPWKNLAGNHGVLESTDAGVTWIVHAPAWSHGDNTSGIFVLTNPARPMGDPLRGDGKTWLFTDQESGFWRTTDAGAHWTQVAIFSQTHGEEDYYYSKTGALYVGAALYPVRSLDNGATWEQLKSVLPYNYYYSVYGDGNRLYTSPAFVMSSYFTSPESDGVTWTSDAAGGTFASGPTHMRFDSINRILYSTNADSGLLALKVMSP